MADSRQFLHARIGRVDEWTVRARLIEGGFDHDNRAAGATSPRRWARLEDQRGDLVAHTGGATLRLDFVRRSEQRRVRRELHTWSRPFVAYLELARDGRDTFDGTLVVMRTALPGALSAPPCIVIDPDTLAAIAPERRPRLEDLEEESVLPSPDGPLMVVTAPMLVGSAATGATRMISVHVHRRWRLDCEVVGDPGKQHLVVRDIADAGTSAAIPDGRLIAIPAAPRVVRYEAEAAGTDLAAVLPRRHDVIEAWIAYEQLVQDKRLRGFDVRRAQPLEYTEVSAATGHTGRARFDVVLASPQGARDHWIDARGAERRRVRVNARVEIVDLDERMDPLPAALVGFEDRGGGRLDAVIEPSGGERVPPVRGRLIAIEDQGDARQRERRKRALDRLRSGTSANPELLGWLMDPATAPPVATASGAGARHVGLDEYQRRAVALATRNPTIVLVLGPPGSGKTTVIRAIVDEYRRRGERARTSVDGPAPFRVLVTSMQNEAVDNVAEKLTAAGGLEIWHLGDEASREARAARLGEDAERIARELWKDLRDTPAFVAYERFHILRDSLAVLRHALFEVGVGPELARRLRALAASDESRALTPLLSEQVAALIHDLDRVLALAPPSEPPVRAPDSVLAGTLARLVVRVDPLTSDTWPAIAAELDAVVAALETPASADADWVELGEHWAELRRRLRREARSTFTAEGIAGLGTLRGETAAALAASVAPRPEPRSGVSLAPDLVARVHAWVHRAYALAEQEISARAQQEEAVLYHWLHTLAREPGRLAQVVERHAQVTTATCQRADQGRRDAPPAEFDLVIVDEAARAGIDVLIPMTLGKSIVLVGDHRQLPPHVESELEAQLEEGLREQFDLKRGSLFSWLWDRLPRGNVVSLSRQYRMHEDIGAAVSRLFYEPTVVLAHHFAAERADERRPDFALCGDRPLVWIDTSDLLQDAGARAEEAVGRWPCVERNEYEARLIAQLLRRANHAALEAHRARAGKEPVGVITFYTEQQELLEERLREELGARVFELVKLGTVDSFQGREFPLVILSAVRSNRDRFVGFLGVPNRINVAMSRAQRQLIVVGDSATLAAGGPRGSPELQRLFSDLGSGRLRGARLASAEVVR